MAKAPIETSIKFACFDDVEAGIVKWPMSVIRLNSKNKQSLVNLAEKILGGVRGDAVNPYTPEYERKLHKLFIRACGLEAK